MIKASEIITKINELLDSAYEYKKLRKPSGGDHRYAFKSDAGKEYTADFTHQHHDDGSITSHVAFSTGNDIKRTNAEGRGSLKVLGTVANIIRHHVAKNPKINKIAFSSDSSDDARKKVYRGVAKTLASKHVEHEFGDDHYYLINKEDMKH